MTPGRALAVVAVLVALAASPAPASAQDEPDADTAADPFDCPEPIDADPETLRERAGQHYDRATELYLGGQFEAAIPEFKATYCLSPVPDALYSVAQCYLQLLDYEQAVLWFERYIRALPGSEVEKRDRVAHRVEALRKLPARLRVATDPPGADIVLDGAGALVRGRSNDAAPIKLLAGTYTMRVELDGYEPITETVVAEIGQPYIYSYRLTPETGQARITTNPPDARIFVDQRLVAMGTWVDRLPVGEHTLTVEASGHRSESRDFEISAGATTNVHVALDAPPRSGRWELIVASSVFGLTAGSAVSTVFEEGSGIGALYGIGGGVVGFAGAYFGAPERMPVGQTSFIIGGTMVGALEAFSLATSLSDDDATISSMTLVGAVLVGAGAAWGAPKLDLSAGDAALVNSGAMWGSVFGSLFWTLFDADDRLMGPMFLAGVNSGLLAGGTLAYKYEFSRGHVALVDLSGLAGAIAGTALAGAFSDENENDRLPHFALGGIGAGLVAGAFLTRHMDEREVRSLASLPATPTLTAARAWDGSTVPVYGLTLGF